MEKTLIERIDQPTEGQAEFFLRLKLWVPPSRRLAQSFIVYLKRGNGYRDGSYAARVMLSRSYAGKYLKRHVTYEDAGLPVNGIIDAVIPKPREKSEHAAIFGRNYVDDKKPFYARVFTAEKEYKFRQLGDLVLLSE